MEKQIQSTSYLTTKKSVYYGEADTEYFIPSRVESLLDLEKRGRITKVPVTRNRITETNIGT